MEPDDQSNIPTKPFIVPGAVEPPPGLNVSIAAAMLGAARASGGGTWQPPTPEELQRDFPLYEITAVLGRGGMGAVYKGWQKSLDRFVAIKILPPGLDDGIAGFTERFKREAKAMAQLKHPGIVAVYDAGTTAGGLLYFVMECVEGTDVHRLVSERGRLDPGEALRITGAVCDALGYAHERGIIHRDIKPSNIMIETGGAVKVADFGLAKSVSVETTMLTMTNVAMGTPDFMAPEALKGAANADHRADLYAVGVMLYQMLTGELPRGRFVPPSRAVPGLDKRLDLIVDKALQPDPAARYSTAIEVKAALEPVTRAIAKRTVAIARAAAPRKKPLLLALAAVPLLAVLAFVLLRPRNSSPQPSSVAAQAASGGLPVAPADYVWQRVWREKEDKDGWIALNNGEERRLLSLTDCAIRLELGTPCSGLRLDLRHSWDAAYALHLFEKNPTRPTALIAFKRRSRGGAQQDTIESYPPDGRLNRLAGRKVEFWAIGTRLTAVLDGEVIGTAEANGVKTGGFALYADNARVRNIEVLMPEAEARRLAGISEVTKSPAPQPSPAPATDTKDASYPQPRAWVDATPSVRADALKKGSLKTDGEWLQADNPAFLSLAKEPLPSHCAVRLRFANRIEVHRKRTTGDYVTIGIMGNNAAITKVQGPTRTPIVPTFVKLPDGFNDGTEHELVAVMAGDRYSLWLDGKALLSASDNTIPRGSIMVVMYGGDGGTSARLRQVEWGELEAGQSTSNSPSPAPQISPTPPAERWVDALRVSSQFVFDNCALTPQGLEFKGSGSLGFGSALKRDGAVRLRATYDPALTFLGLMARKPSKVDSYYTLSLISNTTARLSKNVEHLGVFPLPAPLQVGQDFELELRVVGTKLTAKLDGKVIGEADNATHPEGKWGLVRLGKGPVTVKAVEYLDLSAASPPSVPEVSVPTSVLTFGGHRYQFVPGRMKWTDAKAKAEAMGGHLATFSSSEEWEAVRSGVIEKAKVQAAWLGGHREGADRWTWVTGEPWSFTSWAKKKNGAPEPSNGVTPNGPENCLESNADSVALRLYDWNDVSDRAPDGNPANGFLVEWDTLADKKP